MMDVDLFEFNLVFSDVRRVFPLRADDTETKQLMNSYFQAFRRYPLGQVRAGAESWVAHGKRFPKPAEWIDAIPRAGVGQRLPELTALEASDYQAAEARAYDGDPCWCVACREAGVDHRFLRFVPDTDREGIVIKARIGDRQVYRGHWAHGFELHRWYQARDQFWADVKAKGLMTSAQQKKTEKIPFAQRLEMIFRKLGMKTETTHGDHEHHAGTSGPTLRQDFNAGTPPEPETE